MLRVSGKNTKQEQSQEGESQLPQKKKSTKRLNIMPPTARVLPPPKKLQQWILTIEAAGKVN